MKRSSWYKRLIIIICLFLVACGKEKEMISGTNKKEIEKWMFTPEELKKSNLKSYNMEIATKKKLADGENYSQMYYYMQAAYRMVLCKYITDTYELKTYDNEISECELGVVATSEEDKSIYQEHASWDMTYIYLRNNIMIEQLETADLELLKESLTSSEQLYDQLIDMVVRTYPDVIKVIYSGYDNKKEFITTYDAGAFGVNEALNTSLVLGISYEWEFDEDGMIVDTKKEQQKEEYLEELKNVIVEEVGSMIDIPVTVFIYN